jgi:hypothetical protein
VENGGSDAELSQEAYAAEAKHLFLNDACFSIATIKMAGDEAVDLAVLRHVRVQEI